MKKIDGLLFTFCLNTKSNCFDLSSKLQDIRPSIAKIFSRQQIFALDL